MTDQQKNQLIADKCPGRWAFILIPTLALAQEPVRFSVAATSPIYESIGCELSTNTIVVSAAGDNHQGEQCSPEGWFSTSSQYNLAGYYRPPFKAATSRWTIDTTIRRETATFTWRGQSATLTNDVLLGSVTNRWKLKTDWEKQP